MDGIWNGAPQGCCIVHYFPNGEERGLFKLKMSFSLAKKGIESATQPDVLILRQ